MNDPTNPPIEPRAESEAPEAPLDELCLQRYMDGRLDPAEQERVRQHLQRGAASRRTLDALREEDRLARVSLEARSEPPAKLGEKVLATLYAEHRQRVALERARRLRKRIVGLVSAAALVMLAVWTMKPREQAGSVVSGGGVSLRHGETDLEPLPKQGRFYEGDVLRTGRGQFARLRLSDGSLVDLYEDSRLKIEHVKNDSPMLILQAGRAEFEVGSKSLGLLVETFAGHIRAGAGAAFELWLPPPGRVRWPDWSGPYRAPEAGRPPALQARERRVCLTVTGGVAYVHTAARAAGVAVSFQHRTIFGSTRPPSTGRALLDLHALDYRREGWTKTEARPEDRARLGLTQPFDWLERGRQMGLTENIPGGPVLEKAVKGALAALAEANATLAPSERAARLGRGQQALRSGTQRLVLSDERRWLERTLEGLAHYERGRALLAEGTAQALSDAKSAFLASCVAFQEALSGGGGGAAPEAAGVRAPGLAQRPAPEITLTKRLRDFAPADQALLLARFYQPWALYHLRRLSGNALPSREDGIAGEDPAPLFEQAEKLFGRSIEALGARYGRGLALEQAARHAEAGEAFKLVASASVAGLSDAVRAETEGLRQAAQVERVRLYAEQGDMMLLDEALEAFLVRYPLDTEGRASRTIQGILNEALQAGAEKALKKRRYNEALRCYHELLAQPQAVERLSNAALWRVRVGLLETYVGLTMGRHAVRVVRDLKQMTPPPMDAAARARIEALEEKARLLEARLKKKGPPQKPRPKSIELE